MVLLYCVSKEFEALNQSKLLDPDNKTIDIIYEKPTLYFNWFIMALPMGVGSERTHWSL